MRWTSSASSRANQIPVAWTLLGIGALDETHPLAYGYMGMHGWKHVNRAIQSADLILAFGMRFDDRVTGSVKTYAPYARIVHVDIDPGDRQERRRGGPGGGDARRVMAALLAMLPVTDPAERADYHAQLAEWRRESLAGSWHGSGASRSGYLTADFVIEQIGDVTNHDATMVADVGQNQMWMARYAGIVGPQPPLLGRPGNDGLRGPTAMGAALGRPDKSTWRSAATAASR